MPYLDQIELPDGTVYDIGGSSGEDTKVTQTATSTDADYEILFSGTADNTTRTEEARKDDGFLYNPNKNAMTIGSRASSETVGQYSIAVGYDCAAGTYSSAEGFQTKATGHGSHSEGRGSQAFATYSHAEGQNTTTGTSTDSTSANAAHAEGYGTTATGYASHAEGQNTTASGTYSHAEGTSTIASGSYAHAEGGYTTASGSYSHAEGSSTTASSAYSHAEGYNTTASGTYSHAEGGSTIASSNYQHVEGKYNIDDSNGVYAHIIGNGSTRSNRSNAFTVDWDGNVESAGKMTVGASPTNNMDVATKQYVDGIASDLQDDIDDIDTTLTTKANESIIADVYDNTSTYLVGDYCIYENVLYICNTDISTAEDFDSTHWDIITIITSINSKVSKSGDMMTGHLIGMGGGGAYNKARDYASFKKTDVSSATAFYPIASLKANDSDWSIGVLGSNDRLVFCNVLDSNYDGNINNSRKYYLEPATAATDNLNHRIAHSGNVETGDSNGQVKIAGANVSVKGLGNAAYDNTVSIAHGGTGATTRVNAFKALTNSNVAANVTHFVTFTTDWATAGYSSVANVKTALKIAYGASGSWWNDRAPIISAGDGVMEIGKYIDFHTANTQTNDYTFRFTNGSNGQLAASGTITQGSSRKIKENIENITVEEALKVLELEPVYYDYKEEYGGSKDHRGFIAEDVAKVLPNLVTPEEGDEADHKHFIPASLSYMEIIPYLVKMVQIQQNQINTLTEKLDNLNKN